MAYPKRVYTDGVEEVSYVDMNRIETGIETNDLAIAKINADNIARDKEISTKETITGAQEKANVTLKSAKEYADGKVKLNGESTNVNFISNKVVQDGLVSSLDECGRVCTMIANVTMSKLINGDASIYSKHQGTTGWKLYIPSNTMTINIGRHFENTQEWIKLDSFKGFGDTKKIIIIDNGKRASVSIDGVTVREFEYTDSIKELNTSIYVEFINKLIYNRPLTSQEIQHNFSVLNNQTSISAIETTDSSSVKTSFLFATNTDNVQTRTGHTEEERYTALLSKFGKKFTSTGEDITVENGIENQRVLSWKISGQTVKNYLDSSNISKWTKQNSSITFEFNKTIVFSNSLLFYSYPAETKATLLPNTQYTLVAKVSKNTLDKNVQIMSSGISSMKQLTLNYTGLYKIAFTTNNPMETNSSLYVPSGTTGELQIDYILILDGDWTNKDVPITNVLPFGLSSTQAILTNNGLKYSFYANAEDKAQGKVIDLGGLEGARNILGIKEDGSAVYTKNLNEMILKGDDLIAFVLDKSDDANTIRFRLPVGIITNSVDYKIICDKFVNRSGSHTDTEYIYLYNNILYINILKTKLSTQDVTGFKSWVQTNQITVHYQLATPIVTTIPKEICPAILTQLTNTFQFGDAVRPSSVEITVPVDKLADLEKRVSSLETINL